MFVMLIILVYKRTSHCDDVNWNDGGVGIGGGVGDDGDDGDDGDGCCLYSAHPQWEGQGPRSPSHCAVSSGPYGWISNRV